jgi:hypothetical protein
MVKEFSEVIHCAAVQPIRLKGNAKLIIRDTGVNNGIRNAGTLSIDNVKRDHHPY